MRFSAAAVTLIAALCFPAWGAGEVTVASPDGKVQFQLSVAENRLQYAVTFNSKPIIAQSPVGIVVDGVNLAEGAQTGAVETYKRDESYPWYGAHSTAVDRCNGAKVAVTHAKSKTAYTFEIRVFNDGVAFRHVVPGEGSRTPDEATVFRVPARSTIVTQAWISGYESLYPWRNTTNVVESLQPDEWVLPPMTFRLADGSAYGAITEGALFNYSGMALQADANFGLHARLGHSMPAPYPFRSRYAKDVERLSKAAVIQGTITTPWRIVMIGADLNALVNCDIVHNVAPAPDPKLFPDGIKTEWIKPGRAVWSYLDGGDTSFEGQKEFTRLAGELGFEYNVLENFWRSWPEAKLKELVDYGRQRGVKIIIWSSRASVQDPAALKQWFELCNRTGVAGVKIDFFDHEHKEIIDLYETMLKMGAEHKIIVDFHGAGKPAGQERTYPNMLGNEGVRGLEFSPPYAQHEVTLPFTRLLAGLADYTPTHFGKRMADTTWAHQVANAAILQAPLLVYAAHPANILANPTVDVLKSIPSHWDETVVLPISELRETAAFARRSGDTWFLAITNGPTAKSVQVNLAQFLGRTPGRRSYQATLIRDTGEAAAVKMESVSVTSSETLTIDLRSGGGFVGRFRP
jgi:alpha-glucosidase